jgi:hypothetical protein
MNESSLYGAILIMLVSAASPACAQWIKVPKLSVPLMANGQPNMSAPAPKLPNSKPDFSGAWSPDTNKYLSNIAADLNPENVPFQPWARALYDTRKDGSHSLEDPDAHCLPQGVPKVDAVAYPFKFIATPNSMVIVYEIFNFWRQIFTDGREMDPDANPSWMGYSTGRWEGDTFVVDSKGFNGKAWLDQLGRPTSDKLHVIERFRRVDYGHMKIDITIDDPGAYTKPWNVSEEVHLRPGWEPLEFICNENNKDLPHLPGN